jgi:hypothetical protein
VFVTGTIILKKIKMTNTSQPVQRTIGVYDHNCPSALSPGIVYAREMGKKIICYSTLPSAEQTATDTLVINPTASLDSDYWDGIKKCVESHPNTAFVMFIPNMFSNESMRKARALLANQKNVEYLNGRNGIERLVEIINS